MLLLIWYWIIHIRIRVGGFLTGVSDQTWRRCSWAALSCCRFVPSCCSDAVWDDETLQLKLDVSRDLKMMFYILTCLVLWAPRCLSCCVYICGSCEFLLGWALYRSALQRRLPISAWGNLSVDSVFLIIPAVLHPIALAVTYRNEWQRAAHSRAVLWVHYKSSFSLEVQPRKLSARSDFHSQERTDFCRPVLCAATQTQSERGFKVLHTLWICTSGGCNSSMWRCITMRHVTIWHRLIHVDALPQDWNKKHVTGTLACAPPGLFSEWDHNKQSSNVNFFAKWQQL